MPSDACAQGALGVRVAEEAGHGVVLGRGREGLVIEEQGIANADQVAGMDLRALSEDRLPVQEGAILAAQVAQERAPAGAADLCVDAAHLGVSKGASRKERG